MPLEVNDYNVDRAHKYVSKICPLWQCNTSQEIHFSELCFLQGQSYKNIINI